MLAPRFASTVAVTWRFNSHETQSVQDLTYTVQVSSDLVTWTPIASSSGGGATVVLGAHSVTETGAGPGRTVTVEDSQPTNAGSRRFLRVTMQRN